MQPNLSYYYGQTVESVNDIDGGGWEIVFETGVKLVSQDANYANPIGALLVGKTLTASIMEQGATRVFFGDDANPRSIVMYLNPVKYAISDPNFEDGRLVYPQSTAEETAAAFEPDAPGDRVVEGPSEDWHRAQLAVEPKRDAEEPAEATDEAEGSED